MTVELQDVKAQLHVLHDDDDELLERLISSAVREYARFINEEDESSDFFVGEDAFNGIVMVVKADYWDFPPDKRAQMRAAAETLWMPYRTGLGV